MPKTEQIPEKRIGRNVPKMVMDMRQIVRNSPDSESKDDMKARAIARQRVTIGDTSGIPRSRDLRKR